MLALTVIGTTFGFWVMLHGNHTIYCDLIADTCDPGVGSIMLGVVAAIVDVAIAAVLIANGGPAVVDWIQDSCTPIKFED